MKTICELNDSTLLGLPGRSEKPPRVTARAIVRNQRGQYAVMYAEKYNIYTLPGGGVEDGEDVFTALRREILEETGCICDEVRELGTIYENRASLDYTQVNHYFVVTTHEAGQSHLTESELANNTVVQWHTFEEVNRLISKPTFDRVQGKYLQARDVAALREYALQKLSCEIKRINSYHDDRFSENVLRPHGCFLVNGDPYEIEIISDHEAVVRGGDRNAYWPLIDEFRFYTPHITRFLDINGGIIREYPPVQLLTLKLSEIQPSQFYVDRDKIDAIRSFIHKVDDIIIQVLPNQGKYISLDGHTRLYYAVMNGWDSVRAVVEESDDWVYGFVDEARRRSIFTPHDLISVSHEEYEEKWDKFCDEFFAQNDDKQV